VLQGLAGCTVQGGGWVFIGWMWGWRVGLQIVFDFVKGSEKADSGLGSGLCLWQVAARSRLTLSLSLTSSMLIVHSICVCKLNVA